MRDPIYKTRPVEPNPARFGGERINDFIVLSEAYSNCYLIQTPAGNIQINAGMGMEAPVIKKNFDDFDDGPVTHLVLTQGHVDHLGGVQYFRDQHPALSVIAQASNPEHQSYDSRLAAFRGKRSAFAFADKFADAFAYYAGQGHDDFPAQDAPTADILFRDRYGFTVGGFDIELIAVAGAETNDSLVVWLPRHKICFTGNLFGCPFGHFPNLVTIRGDRYRDALTVANAVQLVRELGAEMLCYGHHGPVLGADIIEAELTALHGAILYVHDETVKGMNEGRDVHSLMREIVLPGELEVGQGYGKVCWSVRAIWENYAGWFQHESTTELYAVPASSISGDLVELAGVEALVERARHRFDAGEPEAALHLLDIVLAAQPNQVEALQLAIAVHDSLLADSENFWLSAWLQNQVKLLRARLGTI